MTPICRLSELPEGNSRQFQLEGQSIFLVRRADSVWGYLNRCPHQGIPLEWVEHQFLDYEREFIQCATHGALFTIERGTCVHGPCLGQQLQALTLEVEGDWVKATLSPS